MVLARKKLKQKRHKLLLGGDAQAEAQVESIKDRLVSSKRPRPNPQAPEAPHQEAVSGEKAPSQEEEAEGGGLYEGGGDLEGGEEEGEEEDYEIDGGGGGVPAAAVKQKLVPEGEAEVVQEQKPEAEGFSMFDAAQLQIPELEVERHISKSETKGKAKVRNQKPQVADSAVGSDDLFVAEDSEKNVKVYVGGIPHYSSEDNIRSFFEACGSITAVDCMTFSGVFPFSRLRSASKPVLLPFTLLGGFYLKIQPYKSNREKEDFAPMMVEVYNRIYVGNLAWDITDDDLKFFSDCKISSI
ncbi:hypothetical protein ABZP36_014230 [Zizania latifolia]